MTDGCSRSAVDHAKSHAEHRRGAARCVGSVAMGCGSSGSMDRLKADKELYLPSTELRFNAGQMQRLNDHFLRGYESSGTC